VTRLRTSRPSSAGYRRVRGGTGFRYLDADGAPVSAEQRARIEALVIPPAWTDVWISPHPNGHIQALGTDDAGRRQYRYHEEWSRRRAPVKFDRALDLSERLPAARRAVTRHLREDGATRERALAAGFRLLDTVSPRVGSGQYLETSGTRGLSTLLSTHISVVDDVLHIDFVGKGGQDWSARLIDTDLVAFVRASRRHGLESPLLEWNDGGTWRAISAEQLNDYVRTRTGGDFTAKDFRTLRGTILSTRALARSTAETRREREKAVREAIVVTAEALGNTPAVAKSSYVDPRVIDRFLAGEPLPTGGYRAVEAALSGLLR
jgi:DNA topoisomerase-1